MALQKLLGSDKLVSKTGEVDTATIEGKTLLIYFSAHWCPPCRGFTPKLAQFYKQLKESGDKSGRGDFELVFASSDQSEEEFNDYFKEAHGDWLALPYAARGAKAALSKHFKVEGIPTLAVVDAAGNTITTDGREMVDSDPEGKKFPMGWKPRTTLEILASAKMTSKDGTPLTVDDLRQKDAFALYFSAHWCGPCRGFTPKLAGTYKKMQEAGQNMEIVFVSSDRDEEGYNGYWGEMPWAAMAFKDDAVAELKKLCEVNGIPSLATFKGSDLSIVNSNARGAAGEDEDGTDFPWAKKPLPPCSTFTLRDDVIEALNSEMCVVLACDCPSRAPGCCPAGCNLKSFEVPNDSFGCDGDKCDSTVEKGSSMFGCRDHNFDLCTSCHSAESASSAKAFDAKKDDAVKAAFTKAAEQFHADAKAKGEEPDVFFFIVSTSEGKSLYGRVLSALSQEASEEGTSTVLAFNLPNSRAKASMSGAITTQSVLDHVAAFKKTQ